MAAFDDCIGVSSAAIRLTALVTMLVDHIGYFLLLVGTVTTQSPVYTVLRCIGRVSFPLFCFLLAEGMERTSDREKYLTRLLLCAAVSQLPYSMMFGRIGAGAAVTVPAIVQTAILLACALMLILSTGKRALPLYEVAATAVLISQLRFRAGDLIIFGENLNVLYTLSLAAMLICVMRQVFPEKGKVRITVRNVVLFVAAEILLLMLGPLCSYSILGVLLPVALWLTRRNRLAQIAVLALWAGIKYSFHLPFLMAALIAALPVFLYTGESGKWFLPKRFLYWFYPAHLLVLGLLTILVAR